MDWSCYGATIVQWRADLQHTLATQRSQCGVWTARFGPTPHPGCIGNLSPCRLYIGLPISTTVLARCSAVAHKCQRPENLQHNRFKLLCCGFLGNTTKWNCCVMGTHNTTQTTVTHKCQRPENPQHNNLKLLCCRFSGRWHLWATVRSAVTVTVTLCLHFTASCMNYANEPSQAAIERARQDDYGVIAFTHAATRLCGQ